ncbi:MAG: hypothetical protein KC933_36490, partial [Myxococcales bacterium]|nr:hypothetical protein [Myxococcales bacterium]
PTGLDAPRPSEPSRAPQPRWADPVTTPRDDSAVSGAEDDPHEPTEDEVAFADTRIRPAHLDPLGPPHWSAPNPSRVGVSASSSSLPVFALPEIQDDGPTRLSLLPPDEEPGDVLEPPDDDPGDGETALDLSLDHPVRAPDEPIPGFVNGPRTAPMRPLGGRPRERWLLGLLLATSVVVAAALAYAILVKDAPTVITVPPAPGAQTSG